MQSNEAADALNQAIETQDLRHSDLRNLGIAIGDLVPTLRFGTTLRILRDLLFQGWTIRLDDEGVILDPPGQGSVAALGHDPEREKETVRRSFSFARADQLGEPATLRFVAEMERRGVLDILADGPELADRLSNLPLDEAIRPELQFVQPGQRDDVTGLQLQDIWRYARHFWSIPYQSTPGRNVFFLVRDQAHPSRPLIGIAALGNPVLGLSQRDDYYGWTARGLHGRLQQMSAAEQERIAARLFGALNVGLSETYWGDLLAELPVSEWRAAYEHLDRVAAESAKLRVEQLKADATIAQTDYQLIRSALHAAEAGEAHSVDWISISNTALYRRKRARTLADLLRAKGLLAELGFSEDGGSLLHALSTEEGTRAIEVALRRIKQQAIASHVMELITCGAVPPYRDALGGKLVAMLLLSSEVVRGLKRRYEGRVSLIASALAGRPVTRPAELALITTSSLYDYGSSQYNRIRIPTSPTESMSYRRIGHTDSFGTVHFGSDTVSALNLLARWATGLRQVNNLFGEGTSPKLRLIRLGLDVLGLDSETFLRHHSPRLLFGAGLCSNLDNVLLGIESKPTYYFDPQLDSAETIADVWRSRWLSPRMARSEILERIRTVRRDSFRLSAETAEASLLSSGRRGIPVVADSPSGKPMDAFSGSRQTFIRAPLPKRK